MFTTRPEIAGIFGVVASTHWIASQVGMAVLERGGNAFDAAVAAAFTLHVAEPNLNGPGGDAPIILHSARSGTQHVVCGQGVAPQAATPDAFRDLGLDLIPATGLLPAVVPGAFDAWCLLLRDWGTWELPDVLDYAIGYASRGIPIMPRVSAAIESMRPLFEAEWQTSAAVFLPGGRVPAPHGLFARPALAATYERLCREAVGTTREARIEAARNAWYRGFVAEAVDRFFRATEVLDVTGRRHRGLLAAEDFARWSATVEDPVAYAYNGHTVLKCGPWSQGPVLLQQLALLRGFDLGGMDPFGAAFVHTIVECAKLAYADREAWYGDPHYTEVPLNTLLSANYNDERRKLVTGDASMELRPGRIDGRTPWVDGDAAARAPLLASTPGTGEPTVARLGVIGADTCHIDVIDRDGNMVSATPSGGWLQSSPVIPELGFPMGTRGQMFWLKPDLPGSLVPGKRPRTTLSPSFALRDGKPWMAFGTPGGDQQDQWSLIFFLRMVHHNMNIQEAIDAPAWHSEHFPSSFWPRVARPGKLVLEGRYDDDVLEDLTARGHKAEKGEPWSEGRLSAARVEDGQYPGRCQPAWHAGLRRRALMLRQPGPAPTERIESVAGHGKTLDFLLQPGLTLNGALTRPLLAAGARGGTVTFETAILSPFRYVVPGPPRDAAHVAWFSDPRSPGEARIERANATFGWRDGAPFVHCHGAWIEPDGTRRGGHILPHETIVRSTGPARAWAVTDVAIIAEPDPETNFTLFHPVASETPADGTQMLLARIRPNEDFGAAVEALCQRYGVGQAVIRSSLGSLIGARFTHGAEVTDYATEVLVRHGLITKGETPELDMLVVDMNGVVHEGVLQPRGNLVCITFELLLEPVSDPHPARTVAIVPAL